MLNNTEGAQIKSFFFFFSLVASGRFSFVQSDERTDNEERETVRSRGRSTSMREIYVCIL